MPARRPRKTVQPQGTLVAAAERLASRLESKAGSQVGEGWQRLTLDMYDAVPELRAAARITGQAMSQCRLVVARVTDGEPAPLDIGTPDKPGPDADHPAQKLLEKFAGGQGGQAAWLDMLGVHLTVTGESISVGALDTTADSDHRLAEWAAYSPEQVVARNKAITVKLGDSMADDVPVEEETDGITAIRIWRPHPRYSWQADSAARAALGAMQEIILYDQHIESSAISRLISAGLLFIPEGLTLPGLPADDDSPGPDMDPFMRFLMLTMSTAIKDRESAAARVPIMVRGDKEDGAAIRHILFSTPFDEKVLELRTAAINRLAVAVDMPASILTGFEDLQHWTGAMITQDWVNNYLQTLMQLACGSITSGWLHRALSETQGADDYSDIIIWFDSSSVRVRENIGPEMQWAWENGLVSDDTARRVLGFDDSDQPTEEQATRNLYLRMLEKSPSLAPIIFPLLGIVFTEKQLLEADQIAQALAHTLIQTENATAQVAQQAGPPADPSSGTHGTPSAIPVPPGGQAAPNTSPSPQKGSGGPVPSAPPIPQNTGKRGPQAAALALAGRDR